MEMVLVSKHFLDVVTNYLLTHQCAALIGLIKLEDCMDNCDECFAKLAKQKKLAKSQQTKK